MFETAVTWERVRENPFARIKGKRLMGHADIATTAKYYSQVDEDHQRKAARVIDELLEEKPPQTARAAEQD
jgi:integrase